MQFALFGIKYVNALFTTLYPDNILTIDFFEKSFTIIC